MSQYWSADDSVKVGERKISIPSENGLQYSPGQKIQISVDPSTKYMDGRASYLDFNVKLAMPALGEGTSTRLQLDKAGASVLIKNIRIYDGSRGNLLESIDSYDAYVACKYDYDKDRSLENHRALREGASVHQPANRGNEGTSQSAMANTMTNPYFPQTTSTQNASFTNTDFLNAKVCIPLHTGIFANSERIFPVALCNGLYIEIDINSGPAVIKQLDSVLREIRTPLNPQFHSLNGRESPHSNTWASGAAATKFYVALDNSIEGVDAVAKFPFVVNESINFCRTDNNASGATMSVPAIISQINASATANGGAASGLVEVHLKNAVTQTNADTAPISSDGVSWSIFSETVASAASYDATFTISNVNLVVSQVELDPEHERGMLAKVKEGKAIEFDIYSVSNYKHSILASDRQTTFQIFSQNSRAKSLLVIPTDSTVYTTAQQISGTGTYVIKGTDSTNACTTSKDRDDTVMTSNRSGYTGICDQLSSIQYTLDAQRIPSREISTAKIATKNSLDAMHLFELEKCLDNSGIPPRSFSSFMTNFVFGRGFSAGGQKGVLDLRGKDLGVILRYQTTTAPSVGKLFNSYVFHLRRLLIRDGSIEVQL